MGIRQGTCEIHVIGCAEALPLLSQRILSYPNRCKANRGAEYFILNLFCDHVVKERTNIREGAAGEAHHSPASLTDVLHLICPDLRSPQQ